MAGLTARPQLKRSMRLFDNLLLTLSSTSPASSVFIIVPGIFATSGSGALLSMLLGACVGICMAFVYAELSSAFPLTGGEYAIIGRAVDPFFGFVVMGVTFASLVLVPAVMSLGISSYLGALNPTLPVVPTAMATIILATAIGILHGRANAVLTGIFLLIEMLALMVVSALGFLHPSRSLTELILHPLVLEGAKAALGPAPVASIGMAAAPHARRRSVIVGSRAIDECASVRFHEFNHKGAGHSGHRLDYAR